MTTGYMNGIERQKSTKTLNDVLKLALDIFNDKDKAYSWYMTPCEYFGNLSPYDFIKKTKSANKVIRFLENIQI